jgi:hypothetical protein
VIQSPATCTTTAATNKAPVHRCMRLAW